MHSPEFRRPAFVRAPASVLEVALSEAVCCSVPIPAEDCAALEFDGEGERLQGVIVEELALGVGGFDQVDPQFPQLAGGRVQRPVVNFA